MIQRLEWRLRDLKISPICAFCRRVHKEPFGEVLTCDAFPDGIPERILKSKVDHRKPYEGDGGKTFIPKNAKGATAAAVIIRVAQLPQPKRKSQAKRARAGDVTE